MIELRADDVTVVRGGNRILSDVSFAAEPGSVTGIIGPNGAGKSTLLGAVAGDITCTRGSASLDGVDIGSLSKQALAAQRAVLPQRHRVSFGFTAEEVVRMGCRTTERHPAQRSMLAMETTDVVHLAARRFLSLSGGEQARVALARVLAQDTPVLLLDEPTASLDLRHQELVMDLARREAGKGRTVIVVVHDLNLAAAYTDRLLLLKQGEVVADDTTNEVLVPNRIGSAYGVDVVVTDHPTRPCPLVVTVPGNS